MASDINKQDDMAKFWSYLNGETKKEKVDQKNGKNKAAYDHDGDHTAGKQPDQVLREENVEHSLSKMLKTFDDIEEFGASELEPVEANSSLESEDESSLNEKKNNKETEVWAKKDKEEGDAPESGSQQPPAADSTSSVVSVSDLLAKSTSSVVSVGELLAKPLGFNYSTLLSGGVVLALVLSVRLLFLMLGTVKDFLEYVVLCT